MWGWGWERYDTFFLSSTVTYKLSPFKSGFHSLLCLNESETRTSALQRTQYLLIGPIKTCLIVIHKYDRSDKCLYLNDIAFWCLKILNTRQWTLPLDNVHKCNTTTWNAVKFRRPFFIFLSIPFIHGLNDFLTVYISVPVFTVGTVCSNWYIDRVRLNHQT